MPRTSLCRDKEERRTEASSQIRDIRCTAFCRLMIAAASLLFLIHPAVFAGEAPAPLQDAFGQGVALYQSGQFEASLEAFAEVRNAGYESGPLYYNMGNCHYKLGRMGKAILFYERARKFMPKDPDLKANLAIANLAVVDRIEPAPRFWLMAVWDAFTHVFPLPLIRLLTAVFFVLTCVLVIGIFLAGPALRRFLVRICWVSGILLIITALSWWGGARDAKTRVEAVIMDSRVEVMSAPTAQGGVEVFSLHEGTKVRIDRMQDEWMEIILPDLKMGWVKKSVLEII
ncbi:tetratricopeptide repeat protein [bacterium]|nr:tetratricopeptide repeat protein [bacterium]